MLIAITGGDGAGKSIVVRQVVESLRERQVAARRIDRWDILQNPCYPTASFLGADLESIRMSMLGMPAVPRFLFFLWSVALSVSTDFHGTEPAIVDGYWMKHAASEIARGLDACWLEAVVSGLPKPELVIYLRLAPKYSWLRKEGQVVAYECGTDTCVSRESFVAHQQRIIDKLDEWCTAEGWTVVDAALPLEVVVARVVDRILDHLRSPLPLGPEPQAGIHDLTADTMGCPPPQWHACQPVPYSHTDQHHPTPRSTIHMERNAIRDQLIGILTSPQFSSLNADPSKLNDDTSLLNEVMVDSLQLLDFIVAMENTFHFKARSTELTIDTFDRFWRVIDFVQSRLPEGLGAREVHPLAENRQPVALNTGAEEVEAHGH